MKPILAFFQCSGNPFLRATQAQETYFIVNFGYSQEYGGTTNQSHAHKFYTFLSAVTYDWKQNNSIYTHKNKSFSFGKKRARKAEFEVAFLYGEERVFFALAKQ